MEEFKTKHYIRVDANNRIIKGFSTAFEQPLETDICINEDGGRHFEMLGIVNPPLMNMQGIYLYKYENGEAIERTAEEMQADIDTSSKPAPGLEERITAIETAVMEILIM